MQELDKRTKAYFDSLKKKMGHIRSGGGWDGVKDIMKKKHPDVKVELIDTYTGYVNSSDIDIYHYVLDGKERYCAEFSYQTAIDDYCIEIHIFDRKPTRQDIMDIVMMKDIEFAIVFRGLQTEFTCWECGLHAHWLDSEGTLAERFERLKDKYCGC